MILNIYKRRLDTEYAVRVLPEVQYDAYSMQGPLRARKHMAYSDMITVHLHVRFGPVL